MNCADSGLDFVDILATFATGSTGLIFDVTLIDCGQCNRVDEMNADKPIAALMPGTIWIFG